MPVARDTCEHSAPHGGPQEQAPVWKPVVMQAKHKTPCSYCHLPISPGNAIYPWVFWLFVQRDSLQPPLKTSCCVQGNYTGYMHLHCALKEADEESVELLPPVSRGKPPALCKSCTT